VSLLDTATDWPPVLDDEARVLVVSDDAGKKALAGTDIPMASTPAKSIAATDSSRDPIVRAREPVGRRAAVAFRPEGAAFATGPRLLARR